MIIKFYLDTTAPGDSALLQKIVQALTVPNPRVAKAKIPEFKDAPNSVSGVAEASVNFPLVAEIEAKNRPKPQNSTPVEEPELPTDLKLPTDEEIREMPLEIALDILSKTDQPISDFAIRFVTAGFAKRLGSDGIPKVIEIFRDSFGKAKIEQFDPKQYRDIAAALKTYLEMNDAR